MCHCFVCDAPAPCKYWGNSTSADDHCHATDKDSKWTCMRQIFKQKLLPASFLEKHQNGVYSTMTPPRQQHMQCHVSVPQSPSVSHGSHPSLTIQSPLLNEGSQNQQRHPSVRVSLSVGATVSSPRAGRGTGNAHIAQSTHSHAIFKRAGAVAPVFATRNASQFCPSAPDDLLLQQALSHASQPVQVAPTTNAFTGASQNNHFQRSFSAPIAPQVQQGQPAARYQVAINGMHAVGPQLARSTSLTTQRTQCLPEPAIIDVSTTSWQDILATVASNLGVADYNTSTPESQHVTVDSLAMHPTANHGLDLQHEPIAESENLTYSLLHDSSNGAAGGSVQADGPMQTPENLDHLIGQSNPVPNEAHLDDFAGAPANQLPIEEEEAHQPEMSRLEPTNILFEFDWV
ncbi:RPM1 interacting protein 13 [Zea mays]|nr:RPM1 interacting protein 13 [Zea mays]